MASFIFGNVPNYMADFENGPNCRFIIDCVPTEEYPSLGYIFFRAVHIFYILSVADASVFLSVRYLEIVLASGVHYQFHHFLQCDKVLEQSS